MKKIFLVTLTTLVFSVGFSQNVEENIAKQACECLHKNDIITEEIYTSCLSNALADVVLKDNDIKVRESINTVEGIQSLLEKSNAVLSKTCDKVSKNDAKAESKSSPFYSESKNEQAQNLYIIAKDLMHAQNYKPAIESLQMALKKDPKFVLALDDIAMCYKQLNEYENAIKYYKKSLEIYPEGDFALVNIGVVYTLKTDYKTALTYYEKLIKYDPNNAEGYFGAGKSYLALNNDEKALDQIFKAHRIYTTDESDYIKDTENLMGAIYQKMTKENKEDVFKKIAAENNITIE
ncbi:tetratricopeptide repeat protein [Flavobacterium piscis]|uniref:Tetratricopeptide (TPR) repeat protein n=1 Tax=Flavobacterium piscis TaxID=1114874 RepID=A0ABU1YAI6_9FLAO|nr:tetratricopeptide repeat protein [Flavobacterium piscis]MDR7211252.1 tetratricopeptide (TPR) repeat protein [Flavobacterium piscis]